MFAFFALLFFLLTTRDISIVRIVISFVFSVRHKRCIRCKFFKIHTTKLVHCKIMQSFFPYTEWRWKVILLNYKDIYWVLYSKRFLNLCNWLTDTRSFVFILIPSRYIFRCAQFCLTLCFFFYFLTWDASQNVQTISMPIHSITDICSEMFNL